MLSVTTLLFKFRQTVHSQYGSDISSFIKFFYYSLFRINSFIVFTYDCQQVPEASPIDGKLKIIRKDFSELENLRNDYSLPREFYCDLSHSLNDFFLAFWDNKPAYIHWVFSSNEKSRFLNLGDSCSEISYILTLPAFRNMKICSHLLEYTINILAYEGTRKIFCVVHDKNLASIKAVQRAGFMNFKKVKSIGPVNIRYKVTAN